MTDIQKVINIVHVCKEMVNIVYFLQMYTILATFFVCIQYKFTLYHTI